MTALRGIATTAAVVTLLSVDGQAHNLDEYLQAARLSLVRDRIALELDLTPGVAVAPGIIAIIDRDADAAISSEEARAYAQTVMSDVRLSLDGHAIGVRLTLSWFARSGTCFLAANCARSAEVRTACRPSGVTPSANVNTSAPAIAACGLVVSKAVASTSAASARWAPPQTPL